jgi:hypothetical protein
MLQQKMIYQILDGVINIRTNFEIYDFIYDWFCHNKQVV